MMYIDKMLMDLRIASWQISDDGVSETQVVSTDPKPVVEGDAIHLRCV